MAFIPELLRPSTENKNHIFITLCEVSPGIIWAGGYTSGVYKINKRTLSVEYFSPYLLNPDNIRPDKYIRDIVKDSKGYIWSGGFYNLKCFDLSLNSVRLYPGINSVTAITEKDDGHMWIGTSAGLYLLDKESGRFQYVALQEETTYINTLYQAEDLSLYIGTNGSGVVVYNAKDSTFKHYHKDNCALISNNIYTILPESDGHILMSTENGISCFHPTEKTFHNWTKEQGLMSSCFSASSGTLRKNKGFVFGSTDGAIEFPEGTRLPKYIYSPMILSDFQILYQTVFPGSPNSPLKENINQTDRLKLKYNQNTFPSVFHPSIMTRRTMSLSTGSWKAFTMTGTAWVKKGISASPTLPRAITNFTYGRYPRKSLIFILKSEASTSALRAPSGSVFGP